MNHHRDNLLSYYESSIPNEASHFPPRTHVRKVSITSDSDSDYSDVSDPNPPNNADSDASPTTTRRPGTPSKGAADRRRIAIVQMDDLDPHTDPSPHKSPAPDPHSSLRARRGLRSNLSGLALVAPPDAALRAYAHFIPPSTAPPTGEFPLSPPLTSRPDKGHHRSASETARVNLSSRDVGTSGANGHGIHPAANHSGWFANNRTRTTAADKSLNAPHRNTRPDSPSRPPSSQRHHGLLTSKTASADAPATASPLRTPEIGATKEIHIPVAGPVVFQLDTLQESKHSSATAEHVPASELPDKLSSSIPYHRYQAALPSLPSSSSRMSPTAVDQPTSPPPRPPRLYSPAPPRTRPNDIDAVKKALQLPPSVSSRLSSRSPEPPGKSSSKPPHLRHQRERAEDERVVSSHNSADDLPPATPSSHRREAAHASTPSESPHPPTHNSPLMSPDNPLTRVCEDEEGTRTPLPKSTDSHLDDDDGVPSVTVMAPPPASPSKKTTPQPDLRKFEDWLSVHPEYSAAQQPPAHPPPTDFRMKKSSFDEARKGSAYMAERPLSPLSSDNTGDIPSPPPKSFRNSFTNGLKRWSTLPRSPSRSSRSSRPGSSGTTYSSRTPSPSINLGAPRSFKKIQSIDPAALYCHEVYGQRTTAERCAIYASKINELYLYDCGLSDWIFEMRTRGSSAAPTQRAPISAPFTPQPRQTSRSSIISEATFPRRPDASTATDLLAGAYDDLNSPNVPPSLPYPSLAINPPRNNSTTSSLGSGIGTPPPSIGRSLVPSSVHASKAGSFFASLGRKASISGTGKSSSSSTGFISAPGLLSITGSVSSAKSSVSKTLSPPPTLSPLAISRPINITNPPSIPGGPRAPRRPQRSQTLMTTFSPNRSSTINHGNGPTSGDGSNKLSKRPSMFEFSVDSVINMQTTDAGFAQQVDKLHALLPHVEKNILAGYLHHAGQDMLAIGQYLEDERMGTVKRF